MAAGRIILYGGEDVLINTLTQQVCVEIVAAMATEMRDPIEFARTLETTFMNGFAEKVVARAAKFKTEK